MAEDSYRGYGDPGFFRTLKTHSLVHRSPVQCPAKVFAKLKAKVLREQMCDSEEFRKKGTEREDCPRSATQEGRLPFPRKMQHSWTIAGLKKNQPIASYEPEALNISPTYSPQKAFSHPYSEISSKDLPSCRKDMVGLFKPINSSPKRQILEVSPKKAASRPHSLARNKYHQRPAVVRDDVFRSTSRATPVKDQPPSLNSFAMALSRLGDCDVSKYGQHHIINYSLPCHKSISIPVSQDLENELCVDVSSGDVGTAFTAATTQSEISATTNSEVTDSQCEFDIDEAPPLIARHHPTLVDEQLIHASPRISIPKKRQSVAEAARSGHQQDANKEEMPKKRQPITASPPESRASDETRLKRVVAKRLEDEEEEEKLTELQLQFLRKRDKNIQENKAVLAKLLADLSPLTTPQQKRKRVSEKPSSRKRASRQKGSGENMNLSWKGLPQSKSPSSLIRPTKTIDVRMRVEVGDELRASVKKRPVVWPVNDITQEEVDNVAEISTHRILDKEKRSTCHQCRRKNLDTKTVCRSGYCVGTKGQFCGPCLRNRYRENIREALLDPDWECPLCRGVCNCSHCR